MKKLIYFLVPALMIVGCSSNSNMLIDELSNKGTTDNPLMYFEGELYTGSAYDVGHDGKTKYECEFKNGLLDGTYKEYCWDPSMDPKFCHGQLMEERPYKEGKLNGIKKEYYPGGQLFIEETYLGGVKHGTYRKYNEDGTIAEEREYKDGYSY